MYKRLPYLALAVLSLAIAAFAGFVVPLRASPPIGDVLLSWSINATANTVTLHLANTTSKDITAYNMKIRESYGSRVIEHETSTDTVALMFNIQERAGTQEGEGWQKRFGNGTFPSGTNRDEVIHVQPGLTDFSAAVDAVIYADKTAESTNADGLKRLLDARKAFGATIQAGNDIIQKALANPNDPNPEQTALKQMQLLQGNAGALHEVMEDLKSAGMAAPTHGQTIREYLNDYVSKRSERAARLLEHAKAGAQ